MSEIELKILKKKLKPIFKGYKKVNASMEKRLRELGFVIIRQKNHYIMSFEAGGKHFEFAIQKTPGDCRSGIKTVKDIINVIKRSGIVYVDEEYELCKSECIYKPKVQKEV